MPTTPLPPISIDLEGAEDAAFSVIWELDGFVYGSNAARVARALEAHISAKVDDFKKAVDETVAAHGFADRMRALGLPGSPMTIPDDTLSCKHQFDYVIDAHVSQHCWRRTTKAQARSRA